MTHSLPPFLRDLLAAPPRAGEGVHNWLFRAARQLHPHLPAVEIVSLLEKRVARCGRSVSLEEVVSAVQNSIGCAWRPGGKAPLWRPAPKWPALNQEQREAVIRDGGGLADLWELSPIRIEDSRPWTEHIIDRLFPGNPLLCCGWSQSDFATKVRQDWRGRMSTLQFIVPSPMAAALGRKRASMPGKNEWSAHTLESTGPRRFLVCEFDAGDMDEQAALLMHLAEYAPLVCVVHSGGKSLHGWFLVQNRPEEKLLKFFRYAVSLGADRATWTRSQFVRMPDGTRNSGKRQAVFFLNLRPMETTR